MLSLEPFVHVEFHILKTQATIASSPPTHGVLHTHMQTYRHIHIHAYPHANAHIHVYTHIHAYTCMHKHSYTHINTHTHINREIKSDSVTSLSHSTVYSQWALPAFPLNETDSHVDTRTAVSSSAPRGGPDQMAACRPV